jgi:diguanylate cyclase
VDALGYIVPWVLASISVGVLIGILSRHGRSKGDDERAYTRERRATLQMMAEILGAADQITSNVENHNTEIQNSVQQVDDLHVTGEMDIIRQALLSHMKSLLNSNRQMQEDLLCTRYRLEEQAQQIDHARREARSDELTGVANRKAFNEKLHLLMDEWRRQRTPFVLILVDLDQFKWVNDAHGHLAGDRVLNAVGTRLKQLVREGDFVGRYGGDEFAILLPQADLVAGRELAEIVRHGTSDQACRVAVRGEELSVSLSVGVTVPCDGDTDESIMHRVDCAMYKAKRLGRNQVQCWELSVEQVPV